MKNRVSRLSLPTLKKRWGGAEMGISFGLFHIWNVPEHDTHHPNQSIPRQNSLLQKICFFSILRSVSLKSETKTSGSLRRMLEGFCTIYPKNIFRYIFYFGSEYNITQHFVSLDEQKQKLVSPRSLWTKAGSNKPWTGCCFYKRNWSLPPISRRTVNFVDILVNRTRKNNVPSAWASLEMKTETYRRFRWAFKNDVMFSRTKKKVSLLAGLILPY